MGECKYVYSIISEQVCILKGCIAYELVRPIYREQETLPIQQLWL